MNLSKTNKLIILILILLLIATPFLYGCKKDEPQITKITYINSLGKKTTITAAHILSVSKIYLLDGTDSNYPLLKDITSDFNSSNYKYTKFIFSDIMDYQIGTTCPFSYDDITHYSTEFGKVWYYSKEFQTYVLIKVFYELEDSVYISVSHKDNLSTISYPIVERYILYKNDTYTMKTITIPTENILEIEYEGE